MNAALFDTDIASNQFDSANNIALWFDDMAPSVETVDAGLPILDWFTKQKSYANQTPVLNNYSTERPVHSFYFY